MTDEPDRCPECGALKVSHPDDYDVADRLDALGYVATDVLREFDDGRTYHGHALDDDRNEHDGFGEVLQSHDDEKLHRTARVALQESDLVCPRHYQPLRFTKSVAPTGIPSEALFAQGKCPTCEVVGLLQVHDLR